MRGLDLIGAGEGLAAYTIMLRIRRIDTAKLAAKVGSGAIPGAVSMVDAAPEFALAAGLPVVKAQLEKIGITADVSTTKTAPKATDTREVFVTFGLGAVVGAVLTLTAHLLYSLLKGRGRK